VTHTADGRVGGGIYGFGYNVGHTKQAADLQETVSRHGHGGRIETEKPHFLCRLRSDTEPVLDAIKV